MLTCNKTIIQISSNRESALRSPKNLKFQNLKFSVNQLYALRPYEKTFAILTTSWIVLGGIAQIILVVYLSVCHNDCLNILPKWMQMALLLSTTILMGPVVLNLYGAFYVFRNESHNQIQDSIQRYDYASKLSILMCTRWGVQCAI